MTKRQFFDALSERLRALPKEASGSLPLRAEPSCYTALPTSHRAAG